MNPYIKILRPKSWLKNLLVFIPILLFGSFQSNIILSIIAFVMLCCVSSLTYVVNDYINVEEDRDNHKNRPLATGELSLYSALTIAEILLWSFIIIGLLTNLTILGICFAMLSIDVLYMWKLRDVAIADVTAIALKYPLRLLTGFIIIGIFNPLLMALVYLIALSLAIMKRKGELLSNMKRKVFEHYNEIRLDWLFIYTYVILNYTAFVSLFMLTNSFIIGSLSLVELLLVGRYYFNIKGYEEAKSLAILKNRVITNLGIAIFILMILKLNGVNWIV